MTVYASPETRIWDYQVVTDFDSSYIDSNVDLAVDIRSFGAAMDRYELVAEISRGGRTVATMDRKVISVPAGGSDTVHLRTKVASPLKWSAETPDLYDLNMTLKDASGRTVDRMSKKMGFKKTEIRDGVFHLNGRPVKVNAQCFHMQHPLLGHAMDEATIRKDMEILKQFGFNAFWTITADDEVVASGTLELNLGPLQTKAFRIPYSKPAIQAGKEYRLNISTTLAEDEIWAGEGHEVAWEQFELSEWNIPAEVASKPSGNVSLERTDGRIIARGAGFAYTFDAVSGELRGMLVDGQEMLAEPLGLNVWRAPISNETDDWNAFSSRVAISGCKPGYGVVGHSIALASIYYSSGLDNVGFKPMAVNAREIDGTVFVDVRELALFGVQTEQQLDTYVFGRTGVGMESVYSYRIDADGTITVNHMINPQGDMPVWLPRVGVCLSLDGSLNNVEWYGRGPQSSYPDRRSGYRMGIYKTTVEDMFEPYLMPQDYGLRMDNRWVRFTNLNGKGLQFSMNEPFSFNAYPFTTENLTRSVYQYQLVRSGNITLNLDYATSGVGCTARGIFDSYRAYPTGYNRTIVIKPIR